MFISCVCQAIVEGCIMPLLNVSGKSRSNVPPGCMMRLDTHRINPTTLLQSAFRRCTELTEEQMAGFRYA